MEELDFTSILDASELFSDTQEETNQEVDEPAPDANDNNETNETSEVLDPNELFDESEGDEPESVGSEKDDTKQEAPFPKEKGSSQSFYSSIASALMEEGVFPDLEEEEINNIKTPEDFINAVENQVQRRLTERQQRIDQALSYGVEPSEIQMYENAINFLGSITEDHIHSESEEGQTLRKQLIYQDFINRGYSQERAMKEVEKSFNASSDIEDAMEALESAKYFYVNNYESIIESKKKEQEEYYAKVEEENAKLKNYLLEDSEFTKELGINKKTRQAAFDALSKAVYKDKETGEYITAIQKAEREDRASFMRGLALAFTLTDGFKNLSSLIKSPVNKQVKAKMAELESKIAGNTSSGGNLSYVTSSSDSPQYIGNGIKLDI